MELRLGTCGWSYADWKGTFYPAGTKDELACYATRFDAVEIDSTWYHIPSARTVDSWSRRTPEGFVFCPKLPGEITHEKLLEGTDELVSTFMSIISRLGAKLGPALVQLAPSFTAEEMPKLEGFLRGLPQGFRYVVEFRHRSWLAKPEARQLLRSLDIGLAMAHHPWYPQFREATTDFAYLRLLGRHGAFPDFSQVHEPRDDAIAEWAGVLKVLAAEVDRSYVFVNNQFEGHSPATLGRLRTALGQAPPAAGGERLPLL
jgi:uncharacterized protein YecE (DUF72 family)